MALRLSRLTKINLGWGAVIITGLTSFLLARKSIHNNRYEVMKRRQKIRDACLQDQLKEATKS